VGILVMSIEVSGGGNTFVQHNVPKALDTETVGVKKDPQPAQKSGVVSLSESGLVTSSRTDSIRPLVGSSVGSETQEMSAENRGKPTLKSKDLLERGVDLACKLWKKFIGFFGG
jgi:hypothetical protein